MKFKWQKSKLLTISKVTPNTTINSLKNSFCSTANVFHRLILQENHKMVALKIALVKSIKKKSPIFLRVSPISSIAWYAQYPFEMFPTIIPIGEK